MAKAINMKPKTGTKQPEVDPKYNIGFGKGVRAGNFRLYKVRANVGAKQHLDSLVIANLSQSWKVQIPSDMPMYAFIEVLYRDYVDGKQNGLNMILSNMLNVALTPRADYAYLVNCITQIFADPNGSFKKDGKDITIVDAVCNDIHWIAENLQEQYKKDQEAEENSPEAEAQLKRDETYHSMLDEINNLENKQKSDKNNGGLK